MRASLPFVALLSCVITGCNLPRPWVHAKNTTGCDPAPGIPEWGSELFITLRTVRCGQAMTFEDYRSPEAIYAARSRKGIEARFTKENWLKALAERRRLDPGLPPILFFHGYNNNQAMAFERARKIAILVGHYRPVIAITWPSYGRAMPYGWDEANNEWAKPLVREVVEGLASVKEPVVIVAHSMGSRLGLEIAAVEAAKPPGERGVRKLILASPDLDQSSFNRWLSSKPADFPVTLYGSTRDQALSASWRWHGYARAGDLSKWVTGNVATFPYAAAG